MANTKTYNVIKAIIDYLEKKGIYYTKEKALVKCEPNTITIKDAKTPIGTTLTIKGSLAFTKNETKTLNLITLPKGTWLITTYVAFTGGPSGTTHTNSHNAIQMVVDGAKVDGTRQAFEGNYRADMSCELPQTVTTDNIVAGVEIRCSGGPRTCNVTCKVARIS